MDVESSSACLGTEEELGLLNPKIAAPPEPCKKLKIILKLKKEQIIEDHQVVPAGPISSSHNYSMKLEATKRKLEQRYGEEAEKKAKKSIKIHHFPNKNLIARCSKDVDGDVRQRLLAKMKGLKKKNQNLKPNYSLYSKPVHV